MKLSTRLTLSMVALTLGTVAMLTLLIDLSLERTLLPGGLARMEGHVRLLAAQLEAYVAGARADVMAVRGAPSVRGLARAQLFGGTDPQDGSSAEDWQGRLTELLVSEMEANPQYLQFRLIGAADEGREIVRVDRTGYGAPVSAVADSQLQAKGAHGYYQATMALPDGQVHVSPVELNREFNEIQTPHVPVLRIATPIYVAPARPYAILIVNVDMRPAFEKLRVPGYADARIYLANELGEYLVHPDPSMAFAFEFGQHSDWRKDFAELADLQPLRNDSLTATLKDEAGEALAATARVVLLAGSRPVVLIETVPRTALLAFADAIRVSSLIAAAITAFMAALVAALVARSLTRPVEQITTAVERFHGENHIVVPTEASGEIGRLARAFARMTSEVKQKTERLKDSNADLQRFAYIASHDLQEPLRTMASFSQLLSRRYRGRLDKEADEFIDFIVDAASRLQRMILDLLAYSRIDTDTRALEAVDSDALVGDVEKDFATLIRETGAQITRSDLPVITGDPVMLRRLFQNLLSNALKFRSDHMPRIEIKAERIADGWEFSVSDNGIGVQEAFREQIFDMFRRLHDRDQYPGAGVGLAIARKVVERHGGRIWVEPMAGGGATMRFTISDRETKDEAVAAE